MYQLKLDDNPQLDLQSAKRIFRTGQTQKDVYLYRIMVDSYAEKIVLQRQVSKAGGWHQLKYNMEDACEMLAMPRYWVDDEPAEVDPLIPLEDAEE
jgi:hypothetical protein